MILRNFLPEHHLSDESKDAVKLGAGTIATMAALVLGLLIASAKGSFDSISSGIRQLGSRVILLDRVMAHYGLETKEARDLLLRAVGFSLERIWPEEKIGPAVAKDLDGWVDIETVQDKLRQLSPRTDAQRWLQSRSLQVSEEIAEARWLLTAQIGQRSIPMPFLAMLISWLTMIFASFGLISPRNPTVIAVLLLCAFSAAGAFFLILEISRFSRLRTTALGETLRETRQGQARLRQAVDSGVDGQQVVGDALALLEHGADLARAAQPVAARQPHETRIRR